MTDQLFAAPSTAPPLLPAERLGRWVLHRAGIVNVWQYDRAELSFGGGRALLRGKNGAGKSKALEVLLPFLLDGDTRSIDAAGRDRTSVHWLMTDGREAGNHVGYVWLELRMTTDDGLGNATERFCTLGAGLKASPANKQAATAWFFITENARVGVDLHLSPEMSAEKLKEQLGSDAVTTAVEHRRRVAARLFDLHDEARYTNLIHLLHRLRDPNIGNKIEAGELAAVLRDALPPPADDAMEKAAERFDTLDQVREQLERTQRTAEALGKFLDTYQGYAKSKVRELAQRVLDADGERRKAEREAKRLAQAAVEATTAKSGAESDVERLREQETRATRELEGLQASDAYKHHRSLIDRRRTVEVKADAARSADQSAQQFTQYAAQAATDEDTANETAAAAERRVRDARPELARLASEAGIDQAVVPSDANGIQVAVTVADGRRRVAQQVRRLAETALAAKDKADRADDRATTSERELGERQAEADAAQDDWTQTSRTWRTAVRAWPGPAWADETRAPRVRVHARPEAGQAGPDGPMVESAQDDVAAVDVPPVDWEPLHRALGDSGADLEELAAIPALARDLLAPLHDAARDAESAARSARADAGRLVNEIEAQRAALEAPADARPPTSRFSVAERDERAGAPFYEVVDVAEHVTASERAGLEAALEASGVLDAWVGNDGLVIHPSTQDVIMRADAPALPDGAPTLADVLVAQRPEVARVLRSVGLGDQGEGPWLSLDGRWSIGPLRGAWAKPEGEYLGAGNRRQTRARRLAELEQQCAERRTALESAEARLRQSREMRERLDGLPATFPKDDDVRDARASAEARAVVAGAARARHDEDRRAAEQARTAAAQATGELAHAAGLESLPGAIAALDAVSRAAEGLARDLRAWERAWEQWQERRVAAGVAAARRAEREAAAVGAAAEAGRLWQEHDNEAASLASLEDAVGATVAEVLASIAECSAQRDQARREGPSASARAQQLAVSEGRVLELASAGAEAAVSAADAVESAAARLGGVVVLPGVAVAAVGSGWVWDGSDPVPAARELRARVGDDASVTDQVVLNRLQDMEDGLAGGYDVVIREEEGVKFFFVSDDTGRQPLPAVAARVAAEAAAAKERLAASEREVIERFLLGELGEELRERLLESHDLVRAANAALAGVQTSHGKGAHLDWRIDQEAAAVARLTADLLVMTPRSADENAQLRDALMELIRVQREKDPALGYLAHLREALDYRRWFRFTVQVVDDARQGSTRALSSKLGLSQGEQRVLSYLALFAAASAHYDGLGVSCPRLLLLDDAFAKVDEPTHGRLLSLLVELNLDFVLTSERMWGCFPAVPSLEIYEALREPSTPGVALVHFRWDGQQRHLIGL